MLSHTMKDKDIVDGWEDIPDIAIPAIFARWIVTPLNKLNSGDTYSPQAFKNFKEFILSVYPFVARDATQEEQKRIQYLIEIPAYLGGLGY